MLVLSIPIDLMSIDYSDVLKSLLITEINEPYGECVWNYIVYVSKLGMFAAKPWSEPFTALSTIGPLETTFIGSEKKILQIFLHEIEFGNIVWTMTAIVSRPW